MNRSVDGTDNPARTSTKADVAVRLAASRRGPPERARLWSVSRGVRPGSRGHRPEV